MINATVIDAAIINDEGDTRPINGIPGYHSKKMGNFNGKYPYSAASKALTSVYKHLSKYKTEWFPWYNPDDPPKIVLVIQNIDNGKKYAYIGSRSTAPQSKDGPRVIVGDNGRQRIYKWLNRVEHIQLSAVGH
jgi:hypothetical protein